MPSRARRALFIALALAIFFSIFLATQSSPQAAGEQWRTSWITAPGAPQRDEAVLHFHKVLQLEQKPEKFLVHVSADNQFVLYVNQQRAGSGPARSDLAHWKYETLDLAPFLHAGANVLAATVWNFGTNTAIAQISDRTGFILHGAGAAEQAVNTDESWEAEIDHGIVTMRPKVPGYYAAEPGERLDAARFDWDWNGSPSVPWKKAVVLSRGALRGESDGPNNWQLVEDALPAMEMKLVPAGQVVRSEGVGTPAGFPEKPFTVPANTKATVLIDNAHLTTGYPELMVGGGKGSSIRLTYTEALVDDQGNKGNRNEIQGKHIVGMFDEFLPDGASSREFMPLSWRTWRYLQLEIETKDQPLQVESLRTWFSAYPFEERAYFRSDDPSLQPIWEIGWRTARLDAHDTYMDTPYWERLQYIGDTRIQALISYAVAGDDRLPRQAIEAFNHSRVPDGLTQSRYPSSLVQMIPTFSLLWVGMVHDFWMYRDDPAFVRSQLPGTRTVLSWYLQRQRPDGLLQNLPWWPFADWGQDFKDGVAPEDENGGSAIIALQFVEALRNAAEMEAALGDAHQAEIYRAAAARAARAVRELCWNRQYGLIADTPAQKHFSQHANILAVWLDVIPAAQQKDVLTKILSTNDAGFTAAGPVPPMTAATYYFRFYLARALEHAGMADSYLQLLGPWRTMVGLGLTTWAESPEPTRSDSHAWSAHPNYDLLTVVAGIHSGGPGFGTLRLEPHLGPLKHVSVAFPAARGLIEAEYTRAGQGIEARITLPPGMSGQFVWNGKTAAIHAGSQQLTLP